LNKKTTRKAKPEGHGKQTTRQRGGQSLDSLTRFRILSEGAVQELCEALEANSSASFDENFRPLLHTVVGKLIEWAEGNLSLKTSAAHALADIVRFLSAQKQKWTDEIPSFAKQMHQLSGKRLPDAGIAWLADEYLNETISVRPTASFYCKPLRGQSKSPAELLGMEWVRPLIDLPDFTEQSWKKWAAIVYARMRQEEESERVKIVLTNIQRKTGTRESRERRRSKKVRLSDKKKEIFKAIKAAAKKPVGTIRGLTRVG
jgi:hypothetical protein